jgi:hypothetical protein
MTTTSRRNGARLGSTAIYGFIVPSTALLLPAPVLSGPCSSSGVDGHLRISMEGGGSTVLDVVASRHSHTLKKWSWATALVLTFTTPRWRAEGG